MMSNFIEPDLQLEQQISGIMSEFNHKDDEVNIQTNSFDLSGKVIVKVKLITNNF